MMSMVCLLRHVTLLFTLNEICTSSNPKIDSDYYFGNNMVVRAGRVDIECDNKYNKDFCALKCGNIDFECINNKCVCIKTYKSSSSHIEMLVEKKKSVEKYKPVKVHTWPGEILGLPILRHHIAHFCPNLEIARKCIRKCTSMGKPAFCGKDHVCYCSHKQKYQGNDPINATDVYTQFKDMYLKYFGPGIFQEKPTTVEPKIDKSKKDGDKKKKEDDEADEKDGGEEEETESEEKEEETDAKEDEKAKEGEEDAKETEEPKEGEEDDKEGEEGKEGEDKAKEEDGEAKEGRRRILILDY